MIRNLLSLRSKPLKRILLVAIAMLLLQRARRASRPVFSFGASRKPLLDFGSWKNPKALVAAGSARKSASPLWALKNTDELNEST